MPEPKKSSGIGDWIFLLIALGLIIAYFAHEIKVQRDCDKRGGVWLRSEYKCIDAKELE
jgi:hypothetical protein